MTTGKPRVLATRHFPPDVEARLAANFDAVLNPEDRLYDGPALIKAAAGCDATENRNVLAVVAVFCANTTKPRGSVVLSGFVFDGDPATSPQVTRVV